MLRSRARRIWLGALAIILPWTSYWLVEAWYRFRTMTALGDGSWRPTLEVHEIFQVIFVVAHCVVRWLPGAVVPATLAWVLTWQIRRRMLSTSS